MPSAAYARWAAQGRPATPCQPVRDIYNRFKARYPTLKYPPSWYANEDHYRAVPPQDHTPFSATGWPLESPEWIVFATDVMHEPANGVDCGKLFTYWLAEAKAGRMPWLKYMIWEAKLYDVRNQWRSQSNSGHYDHIHLSVRTDHQKTSLGDWSLFPGETMPIEETTDSYEWLTWRLDAQAYGKDKLDGPATGSPPGMKGSPMWTVTQLKKIEQMITSVLAKLDEGGPIGDGVTLEDVRAIVREELDQTRLTSSD